MATINERFWGKVDTSGDCWLWLGSTSGGYGYFWVGDRATGTNVRAHRWAYEQAFGSIPDGLEIDHLCRVENCVNPDHLESVTHKENVRRGDSGKRNAAKTHCVRGHRFDDRNTYVYRGKRECRACRRAAVARFKARGR